MTKTQNATVTVSVVDWPQPQGSVHRPGCADIERAMKRRRMDAPWNLTVASRQELAEQLWGEIANDHAPEGTPEWSLQCAHYLATETKIYPCVTVPR